MTTRSPARPPWPPLVIATLMLSPALALLSCGDSGGPTTTETTTSGSTSTADTTATSTSTTTMTETTAGPCTPGELSCEDDAAVECGADGTPDPPQVCDDACVDGLGCVTCIPGNVGCDGDEAHVCNDEGQWDTVDVCDPLQGLGCDPGRGQCVGACAQLPPGNVGCEFFPTVVNSSVSPSDPERTFGVTVVNPSPDDAMVSVEFGGVNIIDAVVAAGASDSFELPWGFELTGNLITQIVPQGALHLRSTQPVAVTQHHPLESAAASDTSLLLPTHAWGEDAMLVTYPGSPYGMTEALPTVFTVTAAHDNTEVTLAPPPGGTALTTGNTEISADGTGSAILFRGGVLSVVSESGADVTGLIVEATGPVQVIGGAVCSHIPAESAYCDSLQDLMVPLSRAGTEFIAAPPARRDDPTLDTQYVIRIVATEPDTAVMLGDAPLSLTEVGEMFEFGPVPMALPISADKPVIVGQFAVSEAAAPGASDPSMLVIPALAHHRTSYALGTLDTWPDVTVEIVAPVGASISVDGAAVDTAGWPAVLLSNHVYGRVPLVASGFHNVTADTEIGVSVYAFEPVDGFGSYWNPAGLSFEP